MCGIVGVFGEDGRNVVQLGLGMLSELRHRGPDGFGMAVGAGTVVRSESFEDLVKAGVSSPFFLGHARLAIVGHGLQPFSGCGGDFVCAVNGEIYNWKELKKGLFRHDFKTTTDSEVVVHLVEEEFKGDLLKAVEKAVELLEGDFALAVMKEREVVLARDFPGVKPLWVGEGNGLRAFASERKALWKIGIEDAHPAVPGRTVRFR